MFNKKDKMKESDSKKSTGKVLSGVVVSDKMDKTVVVSVSRFVKHPFYGKYYKINKKYKAHDESNQYKTGDNVKIAEIRPLSKDKKFTVLSLLSAKKEIINS